MADRLSSSSRAPPGKALVPLVPAIDPSLVIDLRGERVILDQDLAALFHVETRIFNQAFKRNQDRFPASWAFEVT